MIPIIIMSIADETERQFMIGLFMKYKHVMHKTAIKIVKEHQAAEDMVQEACLLMIRNLDKIKAIDDCRMRAYIVSIVRNTSINYVVKRDRRSNLCFLTAEDDVFDSARDAEDVDTNLIRECEIAELKAALKLLEERDQCILQLFLTMFRA